MRDQSFLSLKCLVFVLRDGLRCECQCRKPGWGSPGTRAGSWGRAGLPACLERGGREGGKPCLVPSRVGMAEVTKYWTAVQRQPCWEGRTGADLWGRQQGLLAGRVDRSSTLAFIPAFCGVGVCGAARHWRRGTRWVSGWWLACCPVLCNVLVRINVMQWVLWCVQLWTAVLSADKWGVIGFFFYLLDPSALCVIPH